MRSVNVIKLEKSQSARHFPNPAILPKSNSLVQMNLKAKNKTHY